MLEWLKEILGEQYSEDIDKKVSEEIGKNFVAKADFNHVNETKKNLEQQIKDMDKNIADLKKSAGDNAELLQKCNDLQNECDAAKKKITDSNKDHAIEMAIMQAKGRNPKAIKALLDLDKISLKEDGTIEGLDLESLKETDSYLFDVETKSNIGTGFNQGSGSENNDDINALVAQVMGVK